MHACMAETKENVTNKLPDNTSTKNIMSHDDEKCSAVIIDIPVELEPDLNKTCWIHRVPRKLRKVNEAAYTPQLLSIGPFHYGKPELKSMEFHKTEYQKKFWERSFCNHLDVNKVIEGFMKQGGRIGRIRSCYAGTFEHLADDDDFSKVILKDACFIFELFLRYYDNTAEEGEENKDYILRTPWLIHSIELDLILLENQIPFFVFTELFDFILDKQPDRETPHRLSKRQNNRERCNSLLKFAVVFFTDYYINGIAFDRKETQEKKTGMKRSPPAKMTCDEREEQAPLIPVPAAGGGGGSDDVGQDQAQEQTPNKWFISEWVPRETERLKKIKHFTDLIRKFMCSEEHNNSDSNSTTRCCSYSAKKLDRAGVKFVPSTNHYLADVVWNDDNKYKCIPFMSSKVEIPKLFLQDTTECVLRNVMALEQCVYPSEPYICSYFYLLDDLIDTAEDVELLVEKRIIESLLSSNDAVVDLVNKLCDQTVVNSFCYGYLCDRLDRHYNNGWNASKETLKRVYFKNLWTGSSTVVGIFVTLYSAFSTISTIVDLIFG